MYALRRVVFLPLIVLAPLLWQSMHPTHSWMEGAARKRIDADIAPDSVRSISCTVAGGDHRAVCDVRTAHGVHFRQRLTSSDGHDWTWDGKPVVVP